MVNAPKNFICFEQNMRSSMRRYLGLMLLMVLALFGSSAAFAQWSVHDRLVFEETKKILEAMKVGTTTVTPLSSNTFTLSDLRAMTTPSNSAGTFTYGATSLAAHFNKDHTICSEGAKGVLKTTNPAGIEAYQSCTAALQVTVAMYELTNKFNDRMAEFSTTIKKLSYLTPATVGEIATLKYQLAYLDVLQKNEMYTYQAQMDLHRSKHDIFKQRQVQAEKYAVNGKANKDSGDYLRNSLFNVATNIGLRAIHKIP
jgi:hypothetical protein